MSRILIIEDDMDLQEGLTYFLEKEGYEILTAGTKKAGMEILRKGLCDLILLGCNLPDGSGFDICAEAQEYGDVPILMLTARDTEMDEVKALEMGVADYMSKPFSIAVLKARIRKILQGRKPENRLVSGGITLEKDSCKVYKTEKRSGAARWNTSFLCILWRIGDRCSQRNRSWSVYGTARGNLWMRIPCL